VEALWRVGCATGEDLGRVLCLSPEILFNFYFKWAIFVQFFGRSGKKGGGMAIG